MRANRIFFVELVRLVFVIIEHNIAANTQTNFKI